MFEKLLQLDARLSSGVRIAEKPGLLRRMAALLAHSGDSWFWLLALGAIWLAGDAYWKARAQILVAAILITAVLVMIIKFSIRRKRPAGEWGGIYRATDPHSFPSGHAARALLLAVIAWGLGPAWLAAALAVWAPLVVLARVAMGVHYLSDVLAGAVFGLLAGLVLLPWLTRLFL
jgi:undecaprenyl-diphosphatase